MRAFETKSFEDLSQCSTEKLIKLRDRAKQHAIEAAKHANEERERLADINYEIELRK